MKYKPGIHKGSSSKTSSPSSEDNPSGLDNSKLEQLFNEDRSENPKKFSRKAAIALCIAGGIVVCILAAYLILCTISKKSETIIFNTSVDGVDVSGLTVSEAAALLDEELSSNTDDISVQVEAFDEIYTVSLGEILDTDWESLAEKCYRRGHGSFITCGWQWLFSHFTSMEIVSSPYAAYEEELSAALEESTLTQLSSVVDASWEEGEDQILITLGTSGYVVDTDALSELILEAIEDGDYETVIECPMAQQLPEDVDLDSIYEEIYVEPVNATLDPDDDYSVVSSITGISFDIEEAQSAIDAAAEGETVSISLVYTQPDIDTATLEANLFTDTLGSYTTTVSGSSARRSNVKLAASSCEVILLPGETFSYNDTVGERTAERGYQEASAYLNGETVQELGGGVCQVSSTLYVACLYANLEITERHAHTYASSYVPLGWDATVSWGGPDFQFTNNTNYPIKIEAYYSSSNTLTMTIIGTDETGYTVKIVSETYSTIAYETETIEDDTLAAGTTVVDQTGYTGYKVQTWRYVYDSDGNLISDDEEAYSYYSKRNKIIRVGTKEAETEAETETETEASEETQVFTSQ